MSQNTAPDTASTAADIPEDHAGEQATVLFDPIMVVSIVAGEGGSKGDVAESFTAAIWQVETDPTVARGDFSGAWLVTEEGIQGFAANADWIDNRDNPAEVLRTLLRYPALPAEGTTAEDIQRLLSTDTGSSATQAELATASQPVIVDKATIEDSARAAIDQAKDDFARLQSGKKQPAWGQIDNIQPVPGHAPAGHSEQATQAITAALATARGLRIWLDQWQSFDKTRARRLGSVDSSHSELRPAPLT